MKLYPHVCCNHSFVNVNTNVITVSIVARLISVRVLAISIYLMIIMTCCHNFLLYPSYFVTNEEVSSWIVCFCASLQIRKRSSSRNACYTLELFQTDSIWNELPCWQVICTSGSCSQEHTCVRKWHLQGSYMTLYNQSINQSIDYWSTSKPINQSVSRSISNSIN